VLTPGTILEGRYEILATIAEGGMGTVFRARRVVLGDEVAVKVIRPAGSEAAVLRERFLREARACAQLRHPGIVGILDFSIGPGGEPYLVMELLNGRSLRDELAAAGRLPLPDVQRIAAQVCRPSSSPTTGAWCIATSSPPTSWRTGSRPARSSTR